MPANSFSDEELTSFFHRRGFKSSVVEVNRLNHEEWILLLGDAGHSVIPATGEGINCALEDCSMLYDMMKAKEGVYDTLFNDYNTIRMPDVIGLTSLAKHLAGMWRLNIFERASSTTASIAENILKSMGVYHHTYNDYCFGELAVERRPYHIIFGEWGRRKKYLLPVSRIFMYPIVGVYSILSLPWKLFHFAAS